MTSAGEDRYVYPAEGEQPLDEDRIEADPERRQVTHPQATERAQGTSADQPGFDPSDRERADEAAGSGEPGPDEGQAGAGGMGTDQE